MGLFMFIKSFFFFPWKGRGFFTNTVKVSWCSKLRSLICKWISFFTKLDLIGMFSKNSKSLFIKNPDQPTGPINLCKFQAQTSWGRPQHHHTLKVDSPPWYFCKIIILFLCFCWSCCCCLMFSTSSGLYKFEFVILFTA